MLLIYNFIILFIEIYHGLIETYQNIKEKIILILINNKIVLFVNVVVGRVNATKLKVVGLSGSFVLCSFLSSFFSLV